MASPNREKPRLTEQEKKSNHIASEQKRRQAIRDGFDRLASIVPGMAGQGRSENLVLQATLEYMNAQIAEYHEKVAKAKAAGIDVSHVEIEGLEPPAKGEPVG
jgi:heteromeric Ino2p/Ino4p transcription factor